MRSRDGVAIDEGEKLLEDGEERPVGEHTHALLHLHHAVSDGSVVHNTDQPEPQPLSFRESLPWVRLVELDSSSIHLRERGKKRDTKSGQVKEAEIRLLHRGIDLLGKIKVDKISRKNTAGHKGYCNQDSNS